MSKAVQNGKPTRANRRTVLRGVAATAGLGAVLGSASTLASEESSGEGDEGATAGTYGATAEAEEAASPATDRPGTPKLGANLNGRPRRLGNDLARLDASDTTWVRAFLDIRDKLNDGRDPSGDPDVLALRRAAREKGCRLVVSLKWGFEVNWRWDRKESRSVPEPDSEDERSLLSCATQYLGAIGTPVDVVVLGNEPMWETKREDITGEDPPILRFTLNLKEHLLRHGDHGDPAYLLGAITRLYDDPVREERFPTFCRETFRIAREDDDVDGVDLHVHYDGREEARKALEIARDRLPDGTITVTEFSPVFRYDRHVRTPIGEWGAGRRFAGEYGYSPDVTAVDYFERAKADPRPPRELADFYDAMPWYRADQLRRDYRLFERFDVDVGTFGFLQDVGMRDVDWRRPDWTPFHINFLHQDALMEGRGAHPLYIDDYRELAG
ncbi:hypothetical protein [Halorarum salinum]|uniref:Uncharacterized protein n=1 Tax=Halorarum salinum TaxID=2743089 RepID=A0A7D5LAG0_9EURY|nr:hypothetical protein [Halobaculum salinum]QLG61807.1 hypothetical protein HUG12_08745 [Halobaculum salinum]